MFALRSGKWKLIAAMVPVAVRRPGRAAIPKPFMLFDLQADLGEKNDLAKAKPELVEELTVKLESIRSGPQPVINRWGAAGRTTLRCRATTAWPA